MAKRVAKPIEQEIEDELEDIEDDADGSDDEEEYEYEERSRLVPFLVLSVALLAFVGLGWYAYQAGSSSADRSELTLIEAEQTPIKERPLDAGGMQFPHQDKSVFETIAGEGSSGAANTPQVVNSAEEPMQPVVTAEVPAAVAATESVLQNSVVQPVSEAPVSSAVAPVAEAPAQAIAPAAAEVAQTAEATAPVVQEIKEVPVATTVKEAKPDTIAEKPAPKAAPKAENKPTVKAKPAAASGKQTVQLGAFKSEAEAKAAWKKISGNSALSGKSPQVVKADLGDKGIFYRLRVGGVDATKTCASLAGKSPCMLVK